METAQQFREAVEATRMQSHGITLELMGRILKEVLDTAEVRALVRELQDDDREELI